MFCLYACFIFIFLLFCFRLLLLLLLFLSWWYFQDLTKINNNWNLLLNYTCVALFVTLLSVIAHSMKDMQTFLICKSYICTVNRKIDGMTFGLFFILITHSLYRNTFCRPSHAYNFNREIDCYFTYLYIKLKSNSVSWKYCLFLLLEVRDFALSTFALYQTWRVILTCWYINPTCSLFETAVEQLLSFHKTLKTF